MIIRYEFEKETGYDLTNCNRCINEQCKRTKICDYWEVYARWLEKKYKKLKDRFQCDEEGCKKEVTVCLCTKHYNAQSIY